MNWKEFLKPDLKSTIIYIFLFIFIFSGFVFSQCVGPHSMSMSYPEICWNPLLENPIIMLIMISLSFIWYIVAIIFIPLLLSPYFDKTFMLISVIVFAIECYILSCLIRWFYERKSGRKSLKSEISSKKLSLILMAVTIIFIILIFSFSSAFSSEQLGPTRLENVKNEACNKYMNQTPKCSDWTKINLMWGNESKAFNEFMTEFYACENESCARRLCGCPGY
jgi:hypothetical protein